MFFLPDGKIIYPKTSELRLKNRFVIDDQLDNNTDTNDENDSNSSNSLGLSTFSSNTNTQTLLSPSTTTTLNDSFAEK